MAWTARKISLPAGFEPQTVQPVASLYTDYAIPDHCRSINTISFSTGMCSSEEETCILVQEVTAEINRTTEW